MKTTSKETKPNQNYKTNTSKPTKPKISNQNYQNRQSQVCLELGTAQPQLVFILVTRGFCYPWKLLTTDWLTNLLTVSQLALN